MSNIDNSNSGKVLVKHRVKLLKRFSMEQKLVLPAYDFRRQRVKKFSDVTEKVNYWYEIIFNIVVKFGLFYTYFYYTLLIIVKDVLFTVYDSILLG